MLDNPSVDSVQLLGPRHLVPRVGVRVDHTQADFRVELRDRAQHLADALEGVVSGVVDHGLRNTITERVDDSHHGRVEAVPDGPGHEPRVSGSALRSESASHPGYLLVRSLLGRPQGQRALTVQRGYGAEQVGLSRGEVIDSLADRSQNVSVVVATLLEGGDLLVHRIELASLPRLSHEKLISLGGSLGRKAPDLTPHGASSLSVDASLAGLDATRDVALHEGVQKILVELDRVHQDSIVDHVSKLHARVDRVFSEPHGSTVVTTGEPEEQGHLVPRRVGQNLSQTEALRVGASTAPPDGMLCNFGSRLAVSPVEEVVHLRSTGCLFGRLRKPRANGLASLLGQDVDTAHGASGLRGACRQLDATSGLDRRRDALDGSVRRVCTHDQHEVQSASACGVRPALLVTPVVCVVHEAVGVPLHSLLLLVSEVVSSTGRKAGQQGSLAGSLCGVLVVHEGLSGGDVLGLVVVLAPRRLVAEGVQLAVVAGQLGVGCCEQRRGQRLRDRLGVEPVGSGGQLVDRPPYGRGYVLGDAPARDVRECRVDVLEALPKLSHEPTTSNPSVLSHLRLLSQKLIRDGRSLERRVGVREEGLASVGHALVPPVGPGLAGGVSTPETALALISDGHGSSLQL